MTEGPRKKLDDLRARQEAADKRYQKGDEIGRGGMGAVHRVHDLDFDRELAMKVTTREVTDPEVVQRFLDEVRITGQLDHPGVVPVHDLGIDAAGKAWFTMRLVKGETADVVFRKAREEQDGWTRTRALEVILKVCDTMAFAHRKGVLHRDLKPSNVMVGKFGEVYVMDWGLAKVVGKEDKRDLRPAPAPSTVSKVRSARSAEETDTDSPVMTVDGAVVGTPCYMSLEQAEGRVELLDQRADVYAIGAMLYELLTGRQPYVSPGARVSPYAVLAAIQAGPPAAVDRLDATVAPELAAVCHTAMERDLSKRYAGVGSLAEDLRAYIDRRVVKAYRTGAWTETVLWVRRNRTLAFSMAAVMVTLVSLSLLLRLNGILGTQVETASWVAFNYADRLLRVADREPSVSAQLSGVREGLLQLARAVAYEPTNEIAWERFAFEVASRRRHWIPPIPSLRFPHDGPVTSASFSRDGKLVLTSSEDRTTKIWDASTGTLLSTFVHQAEVESAVFSADSKIVNTITRQHLIQRWIVASGTCEVAPNIGIGSDRGALFSSSGNRACVPVYSSSGETTWRIIDLRSGALIHVFEVKGYQGCTLDEDRSLFMAGDGEGIDLLDIDQNKLVARVPKPDQTVRSWRHAAHGEFVAACIDGSLWIRSIQSPWRRILPASSTEYWGGFETMISPDGTRILSRQSVGGTRYLGVLAVGSGTTDELRHDARVGPYCADGLRWSSFDYNEACLFSSHDGALQAVLPNRGYGGAVDPSCSRILTIGSKNAAELWDVAVAPVARLFEVETEVAAAEVDAAGEKLLLADQGKNARVLDLATGAVLAQLPTRNPPESQEHEWCVTFSHDWKTIASAINGAVVVWDAHTGRRLHMLPDKEDVAGQYTEWMEFSSDDKKLVTRRGIWNLESGRLLASLGSLNDTAAAWHGSGERVATWAGWVGDVADGVVRFWGPEAEADGRLASATMQMPTDHFVESVVSASPASDEWLVAYGDDSISRIDAGRREVLATLRDDDNSGRTLRMSADGRCLIAWSRERMRLLDPARLKVVAATAVACKNDVAPSISDDGRVVVVPATDRSVRVFDFGISQSVGGCGEQDVPAALAIAELLTGQSLSTEGEVEPLSETRRDEHRRTLLGVLQTASPLTPLVRWLVERGPASAAYPGAKITCRERADALIRQGGPLSVRDAYDTDPTHPLVHIALAAHEDPVTKRDADAAFVAAAAKECEVRRAFLRDFDLDRLPSDPAICARAAEMLLKQGDKERALRAVEMTLAIDPANATALRVKAEASK